MKSYKQFVSKTYTAQERLDEVLGFPWEGYQSFR